MKKTNLVATSRDVDARPISGIQSQPTKRIMVDMSVTLLHHGHIRLLQKASELGDVIVALTTDEGVQKAKGYQPELSYQERKEIMDSISYVTEVIPSDWAIDDNLLIKHNIDLLVHGDDNANDVPEEKLVIFPRTEGVSSSDMRIRVINSLISMNLNKNDPTAKVSADFLESMKKHFKMD